MLQPMANTKTSYQLMRLDFMLDRYKDWGFIDMTELHEFVIEFRKLPKDKQTKYAFLLDECAELFDDAEQPVN